MLSKKISKPTKTTKKYHSFYNAVSLKKPRSLYEPQLDCKYPFEHYCSIDVRSFYLVGD